MPREPERHADEDDAEAVGSDGDREAQVIRVPIEDSIDLHAFAPRDIPSVVDEYVTAAFEAGLREVRLIHGRGRGVQRAIVQRQLARHPNVRAVHDAPESHLGATIAQLGARR